MRSISLLLIALFISVVGLNAMIITVNWDGSGNYLTIQEGINAAVDGDTVLVYPGTYQETINYNGKNITVGSLFLTTADSSYIELTKIKSSTYIYSVRFENGENNNAIIKGFTLGGGYYSIHSKGVYCNNSSPIISDNIIETREGTGIRCEFLSIPVIQNNTITLASRGIHVLYNSSPKIIDNNFFDNEIGVFVVEGSPIIKGNTIKCNNTLYSKGISGTDSSNITIINNKITDAFTGVIITATNTEIINNLISNCYYGIICYEVKIINCTIVNNSFYGVSGTPTEIINCIIWGNNSSFNYGAELIISHSCIEGPSENYGTDSNGNISRNPCFVDTLSEDYHLQMASPCREAGTIDTTGLNLPEFDLDGNLRIQDGNGDGIVIIDMGCYESETV
ncbi:MAG: right-handed parallel beta-helix repeat-containing protein, partial [Candidatus Cloacimonetes bacterium]|nr:right-handed parallel beta-helix repeat-containing protein [Candidatus Cloacimonadota bacterium]